VTDSSKPLDLISRYASLGEGVLHAVLEEMVDGVVLINRLGIIRELNPAAMRIFGYQRQELLGVNVSTLMPRAEQECHDQYLRNYLETGQARIIGQGRQVFGQRKDGTQFPMELAVSEVHADGQHLFAGIVRDITERHAFQQTLALFQRAMDSAHNGVAIADLGADGERITYANRAFADISGYQPVDLLGKDLMILSRDTRDTQPCRQMIQAMSEGGPQRTTLCCLRPDGRRIWIDITLSPIINEAGEISQCIAVLADVTTLKDTEQALLEQQQILEQRVTQRTESLTDLVRQLRREVEERTRAETALRLSERRLVNAQRIARIGHWEWEIASGRLYWSDQIFEMMGLKPGIQTPDYPGFLAMVPPEDRQALEYAIKRCLEEGVPYRIDHRILCPDGGERVLEEDGELVRDEHGEPLLMRGTARDITERREHERQLRQIASFDTVTGLPNRTLFEDRLGHALANAQRSQRMVALLFLDMDRFKQVNDSLGHMTGDELLRQTSERLLGCVRDGDTVARFGGDEFVLILENLEQAQQASLTAERIIQAMEHPFRLGEHEHFCNVSIGISLYPTDDCEAENLVRYADSAMYLAKGEGGAGHRFYTPDMNARAMERLLLQNRLHQALELDQLEVHYQPQLNLQSGQVTSVEALVRWRHPELGLIPPAEFIPVAEDTGLIERLGEWVLHRAIADVRAWETRGLPPMRLSVNLSPRQFRHPDLTGMVARALEQAGLPATRLELEITERLLIGDIDPTVATLAQLSGLGVRISIDDFGTGHSSLAYLKRLPVHVLKIDREFVDGIGNDSDDAAIAEAILALGRTLRLEVVAEGVERREQASFLRERGCDSAQGFFISRPLPAEDLALWLEQRIAGQQRD